MKKRLSAFTLIETIIVLAIFSVIMFSVMQLMVPVSKYFVRSSNFENSTACLDNMRRCIEGNLMYADRIRVYAGYEPYHYAYADRDLDGNGVSDFDFNGDGVCDYDFDADGSVDVLTSDYTPSNVLVEQVRDFHRDFFADRVCFDATGTIYALCFDNTVIVDDAALANVGLLSDYSDMRLNQGKILLYAFSYGHSGTDSNGMPISVLDVDNPVVTQWAVNQNLYGTFDYTYYMGSDGTDDAGNALTDAAALLNDYAFIPTDCKIHIQVTEVKRGEGGGLTRANDGAVYQNTFASFILENALEYGDVAFTNNPQWDTKILYDPTLSGVAQFRKVSIVQITNLMKMGAVDADANYETIANAAQSGVSSGFYFIFTTPDSTNNVDPNNWGITVAT